MDWMAPVIVVITMCGVIGFIVRTVVHGRRQQAVARLQAEMQTRLIERFGSDPEALRGYLESEAGQRFLESATIERGSPYPKILASVQSGVLLACVGLAFLFLRAQLGPQADEALLTLGTLALALGVGFLASAGLAFRLARSWGLLPPPAGSEEGA